MGILMWQIQTITKRNITITTYVERHPHACVTMSPMKRRLEPNQGEGTRERGYHGQGRRSKSPTFFLHATHCAPMFHRPCVFFVPQNHIYCVALESRRLPKLHPQFFAPKRLATTSSPDHHAPGIISTCPPPDLHPPLHSQHFRSRFDWIALASEIEVPICVGGEF